MRHGKRCMNDSQQGSTIADASAAAANAANIPRGAVASNKWSFSKTLRAYGMVIALIIIWAAFDYATGGVFLRPRNFSNLMRQTAVTGILSVGMLMVIVAGEIDLSVGSLVGLTGMMATLVQAKQSSGLLSTLSIACALGIVVGTLQGATVAYLRVPSFIVTLGGLLAWRGVTKGASGGVTIPVELSGFNAIGQSYLDQVFGIVRSE